jgi:hypothetical protein
MSVKMNDVSIEIVERMVTEHSMHPVFVGQNPYIATSQTHEILASLTSNGLYQIELLDKRQTEESLQKTIRAFQEYSAISRP